MRDSSNQETDAVPPAGGLLWTKRFPDGQLFHARRTMPFNTAIQTVEGVLAQFERETNGQLKCQPTEGLSQVRFTLAIESGKKGLDIVVGNSTPGLLGWGYYTFPSNREFHLWADIGAEIWKVLDHEMDKAAGLILIDQHGWDSFEDTPLDVKVFIDGRPVDIPILSLSANRPYRVAQAVEKLLAFYGEVAEVNRIIDEFESGRALPAVIGDQVTAITPTAAPERVTVADAMVGMTEPLRAAVNEYLNAMTAPMREAIKETIGTELRRTIGLDEESFERAREKYARQEANQDNLTIEAQPPQGHIPMSDAKRLAGLGRANPALGERRGEKRGKRGNLSKADKMAAVREWDKIDKDINPIKLDEWLEQKFGADNGVLRVAVSTFHSWRKHRDLP